MIGALVLQGFIFPGQAGHLYMLTAHARIHTPARACASARLHTRLWQVTRLAALAALSGYCTPVHLDTNGIFWLVSLVAL